SGGELPAMVIIDAVSRLLPGVLGDSEATDKDSHTHGLLEHPHYTRPPVFRGWEVPDVLRSGDHARIAGWRKEQSLLRTFLRRPELLDDTRLTDKEREILEELIRTEEEDST
ncbi:MAG: tRNA (guanosine(37)-N1)-methyltransferase TrmD, partial [Anaerolineales bacterium]|nr:tRNA (guanosine(37)-N1)-methyltransferase TrmD [Anaerolineales bacterium]